MGWGQSKYIVESELSENESEESYQQLNDNNIMEVANLAKNLNAEPEEIDALSPLTHLKYTNIELSDIETFEKNDLEEYEIVSLIYLLYDECAVALNDIKRMLINKNNTGYIYKWALNRINNNSNNWKTKLIEALCIIQNYKILRDLGFDKGNLIATFLSSHHNESFVVNKRKKVLYLIAEQLPANKTTQFISKIEELLKKRNISCPDDFAREYLELYFLYLESHNIDLMEIKSILKVLDYENCVWQLESVLSSTTSGKKNLVGVPKYKKSVSTAKDNTYFAPEFNSYISSNSSRGSLEPENDYIKYDINSDNPGVVLIINQEEFYTETEPKYRHLLYEKSEEFKLEQRKGTEKDKTRLELLFKKMKFTVISNRQNLPHFSLISTIEETTNSITDESSLIICILSHGDKGVVYGANSCKVQIDDIKKMMCGNKNLNGKPKVLILQSCQGMKCQNLEPDLGATITTDGPFKLSSTTDLLVFFATIPGFAAIRNTNTGSWFIQALCEEIEKGHEKYHFLDICTKANQRVTSQIWSCGSINNVMTPMFESTFTKFFFLPRLKK